MKSIQLITADAHHVTRDAAINELRREIQTRVGTEEKPGGAYTRWAKAQPTNLTKHRNYEKQTSRLIAALHVIETMTDKEWHAFTQRFAENERLKTAQQSLF